jgi:hypothetical protein
MVRYDRVFSSVKNKGFGRVRGRKWEQERTLFCCLCRGEETARRSDVQGGFCRSVFVVHSSSRRKTSSAASHSTTQPPSPSCNGPVSSQDFACTCALWTGWVVRSAVGDACVWFGDLFCIVRMPFGGCGFGPRHNAGWSSHGLEHITRLHSWELKLPDLRERLQSKSIEFQYTMYRWLTLFP